jgi:hypothetical protein
MLLPMTMLPVISPGCFCRLAGLALLLAGQGIPAAAQTNSPANLPANPPASEPAEQMPGETEDVAAGATIVRGRYTAGDVSTEWEAALKDGKPERIAEWRSYGDFGNANVVFSFHNGELMHYGEHGRRRGGQAGSMDGFRRIELNLSFADGRFRDGFKTVDGIETEPGEAEIRAAQLQATAALERLATARPAWQSAGQSTSFSITSMPERGPSAEARQLAGAGGEIVFRCSDSLHVVLGAAEDRLVVETRDRPPVTLRRQPSGARYDYFGAGWGAERSGEEIRLEEASGRAFICRIVSAAPPPSALPPNPQ